VLSNGGKHEGAGVASPDSVDSKIAETGIGVRNVEPDSEDGKNIEYNHTQGDLATRNFDCLFPLEIPIFRSSQENNIPAHQGEEGCDHRGPEGGKLSS
jgi:hypothetical protein